MRKLFIAVAFVFVCFSTAAQNGYSQKLYAYKEIKPNTNIFITDTAHGNATGVSATYLIYIELPARDTPIWNSAVIGSDLYLVHASPVEETPVVVGERKTDRKLIKIRPQPANKLWKLEFDLTPEKAASVKPEAQEAVVLQGVFKNRKVTSTVRGMIELAPQ